MDQITLLNLVVYHLVVSYCAADLLIGHLGAFSVGISAFSPHYLLASIFIFMNDNMALTTQNALRLQRSTEICKMK